jgi:hypothetical protein
MVYRCTWLTVAVTCVFALASATAGVLQPCDKETVKEKAREWFGKAVEKLLGSNTAEWDTTVEVIKAPAKQEQKGRKFPVVVGSTKYHFRIKGKSRVSWSEQAKGKEWVPTREAWYEGYTWYLRYADAPKKLIGVETMEREGPYLKHSFTIGGATCWRFLHVFDYEDPKLNAFVYVELFQFDSIREDKLDGRPVVVIDFKINLGAAGHSGREPAGTSRVWIDREKLLFVKRETTLWDAKKAPFIEVRETYSDWKLDQPLANELFHVEGMGPPHALVDAPENLEEFEQVQTAKFLGFPLRDFPKPQGPSGFDELPKDSPPFAFTVAARKLSGPEPLPWYEQKPSATTKGPDGKVVEAYCGGGRDKTLAPGHKFQAMRENRRHDHGGGSYYPSDLFIGKRLDDKLHPTLYFRDVGSQANLHDLALDSKGRCHLTLADVDGDRFKLLWLVGDLSTGKWAEAWCVAHHQGWTTGSRPRCLAWDEGVHLVWGWDFQFDKKGEDPAGVFHVAWTPAGFGPKTRLHKGSHGGLDMAVDPKSGRLLVVFTTDKGVFVASRPAKGPWTQPVLMEKDLTDVRSVTVQFADKEGFVIRTRGQETKEWLLKAK